MTGFAQPGKTLWGRGQRTDPEAWQAGGRAAWRVFSPSLARRGFGQASPRVPEAGGRLAT